MVLSNVDKLINGSGICHFLQSCVETFLLRSKNHPQNVPLPTLEMH